MLLRVYEEILIIFWEEEGVRGLKEVRFIHYSQPRVLSSNPRYDGDNLVLVPFTVNIFPSLQHNTMTFLLLKV